MCVIAESAISLSHCHNARIALSSNIAKNAPSTKRVDVINHVIIQDYSERMHLLCAFGMNALNEI